MKKLSICFIMFALALILGSCGEKSKDKESADKSTATNSVSQMGLKAPEDTANKKATSKNDEGISHFVQSHWDTAAGFFKEAIVADPNLAEAHFNLALSLHQAGKHGDDSKHFKKAQELASGNSKIVDNKIFKDHVK